MINHKDFKYKAVIDWIEFEINTLSTTNFQTIRRSAKLKYVKALDEQEGRAATIFNFRKYDITQWKQVSEMYEAINEYAPLAGEPIIKAVEISFDAYSKKQSLDALKEHVEMFYKMITNEIVSSPNQRRYNEFGEAEAVTFQNSAYRLHIDKTMYIGSQKDDDLSLRCYLKTKDNDVDLPVDEQRARIEVTLKGNECPFNNLNDAVKYEFKKLAKFFKFRKLLEINDPLPKLFVNRKSQFGEKKKRVVRGKKPSVRLYDLDTKANIELNKIAYDKLRYLSKSMIRRRVLKKIR
jgi:hypothetical protein